jgi:hypothetical protein
MSTPNIQETIVTLSVVFNNNHNVQIERHIL